MMNDTTKENLSFICKETVKSTLINISINAGFAFLVFSPLEEIRLWGMEGLFFDLSITTILMPFLMTIVLTAILRRNKKPDSYFFTNECGLKRFFPGSVFMRATVLTLLSVLLLLPSSTYLMALIKDFPVSLTEVIVLKSIYGGVLSAVITPIIIICEGLAEMNKEKIPQ